MLVRWERPSVELKAGEVHNYMQEKVGVLRLERFRKTACLRARKRN